MSVIVPKNIREKKSSKCSCFMGKTGLLAGIPASFAPDMMAASAQFCLRLGGGWWGGGAGFREMESVVSNYTFPFRKRISPPHTQRGTLNDSPWKNLLDVIFWQIPTACVNNPPTPPSTVLYCLTAWDSSTQQAWNITALLFTCLLTLGWVLSLSLSLHLTDWHWGTICYLHSLWFSSFTNEENFFFFFEGREHFLNDREGFEFWPHTLSPSAQPLW
jgi:hypothetical protein